MGYLNKQLEKVASAVEGEMEKQALSLGRLVGMGINAAHRGKLDHFAKRLAQRNQAIQRVAGRRRVAFDKSLQNSQYERDLLGRKTGQASLNARRLGHRVPATVGDEAVTANAMSTNLYSGSSAARREVNRQLAKRQPVSMDLRGLTQITKDLRSRMPNTLKKITNGNYRSATFRSPVRLHNMSYLPDEITRAGLFY